MKAIVTLVVGKGYEHNFARYCWSNWKSYADRHGIELIVYDKLLDNSKRALSRSAAWQKCLALCDERVRKFEQVVWIDSDIVINSAKSPNVFEGVSPEEIGAVPDYAFPSVKAYLQRLEYFYRQWDLAGVRYVRNLTPQEFLTNWGLPAQDHVVQTGVLVMNPISHEALLKRTYEQYEDKGDPSWNYEMRPLSYEIIKSGLIRWLDMRFNVPTIFGVKESDLAFFQIRPPLLERLLKKAGLDIILPIERNRKIRAIHKEMLEESYFLHFAGRSADMRFLGASH